MRPSGSVLKAMMYRCSPRIGASSCCLLAGGVSRLPTSRPSRFSRARHTLHLAWCRSAQEWWGEKAVRGNMCPQALQFFSLVPLVGVPLEAPEDIKEGGCFSYRADH